MLGFIVGLVMAGTPLPFADLIATTTPQEIWIDQLHQCENPDNVKCIVDVNGKLSCGYLMFQYATWLSYGKPFGATRENIQDKDLQVRVATSMLDAGETWHWKTCAARTAKKLGAYPLE